MRWWHPLSLFVEKSGFMPHASEVADQCRPVKVPGDRIVRGGRPGDCLLRRPAAFEGGTDPEATKASNLALLRYFRCAQNGRSNE
jgi:hypothetical protein